MFSGLKSAMPPSLMLTLAHVLGMYVFVSGERCMDDLFEDSGPQRCGGQRTLVTTQFELAMAALCGGTAG